MPKNLVKREAIGVNARKGGIFLVDAQTCVVAGAVEPVRPICVDLDVFDCQVKLGGGIDELADTGLVLVGVLCDGSADIGRR